MNEQATTKNEHATTMNEQATTMNEQAADTLDPQTIDELRTALRNRFETDARLGVSAVPVTLPLPPAPVALAPAASRLSGPPSSPPRPSASSAVNLPSSATTRPPGTVRPTAPSNPHPTSDIRHPTSDLPLPTSPRPPVPAEEIDRRRIALKLIDDQEVKGCTKCGLARSRTKTVFGQGHPAARIMFIGEAPGHDEDISGLAFVGRAGQLLTDMLEKGMGLKREDVFIANVLKCRPPGNRNPAPDETIACKDYLLRQIQLIQPEVIVALGVPAAQLLLNTRESMARLRGRWHNFYPSGSAMYGDPIPVLATYHPAYLLRTPEDKIKSWEDLKLVMARLGIPLPTRS